MRNKILVAGFFVSVMLLVSMASVVGVSDVSNDVEDDNLTKDYNMGPRVFKRVYIWARVEGGRHGYHWDRGQCFDFDWTGTLYVLDFFPLKYHEIKAGLNGRIEGFRGFYHSVYWYPETNTVLFGYARLLHLN